MDYAAYKRKYRIRIANVIALRGLIGLLRRLHVVSITSGGRLYLNAENAFDD
jgi:hypothetical protein